VRVPAVLLALLVAAPPALATSPTEPPALRTERVWFHCAGQVPVQNVPFATGQVPGWDTTAPTRSVQSGAGCGWYENAGGAWLGPNRTTLDAEWEGTFRGNVDSLTVELHDVHVSAARATGVFLARATLLVDGKEHLNTGEGGDLRLTPVPSQTRLSERMTFTLAGLDLDDEPGTGSTVRRYRLVLRSLMEEQSAWVWDATEVPSGITFNPAAPEAVTVRRR
jgi:hypothetical protein